MTVYDSRDTAHAQAKNQPPDLFGVPGESWSKYAEQVANGADYMLFHPFQDLTNSVSILAGLITGNGKATHDALGRLLDWAGNNQTGALKGWVQKQLQGVYQEIFKLQVYLIKLIALEVGDLRKWVVAQLALEAKRRIEGDKREHKFTLEQIHSLHALIEHEAASAYRAGFSDRLGVASRIVDYLANHNGIVGPIVRDLTSGILDLLSVDDPVARLAVGFILRHFISKLGVDRLAGDAVSELLAPLLGQPRPRNLPDVIRDVSARLGALEGQQEQFWTHGGSEVEQAGSEWATITSPLVDAAIVAWLGEALVDPEAWARQITDVIEPVMTAAKDAAVTLIKDA